MRAPANPARRQPGLQNLALIAALFLAGCAEMQNLPDGLYFRPPVSTGWQSVTTTLAPAEVAQAIRAAGFSDVRVMADGTVRLRSKDPALVDCGTVIQVALGNRAEFPGNVPEAVLMSGFAKPGLVKRDLRIASEVRLTSLTAGGGYAIDESHRVTKSFVSLATRARSTSSITFDETTIAHFPDKTSCRSSGLVGKLLR